MIKTVENQEPSKADSIRFTGWEWMMDLYVPGFTEWLISEARKGQNALNSDILQKEAA